MVKRFTRIAFVRFCLVGVLGFIINFGLLTFFYKSLAIPIFISQLLAAEIALFSNFLLHNYWTYVGTKNSKSLPRLAVEFHVTSWMAILGSAILVSFFVQVFNFGYGGALVASSLIVLGWNFAWTRFYIWKSRPLD